MTEEESAMEKRLEDGVLGLTQMSPARVSANLNSNASSRAHPGAALLSPQVKASGTPSILLSPQPFAQPSSSNTGLLSPAGSRYAFEEEPSILAPRPMSPILDTSLSGFNNSQRPLSAQDFTNFGSNAYDPFRPFSSQPANSQDQHPMGLPERPLSAMEIDSITFKNDVANLVNWLGTLTNNQQRSVVDNLLSNVSDDILGYARTRVEELTYAQHQQQHQHQHQHQQQSGRQIVAPQPLYQSTMQEPVTLDSILNGSQTQQPWSPPSATSNLQRALSPNFSSSMDRTNALAEEAAMLSRPRSADPYSKTPSKGRGPFQQHLHNQENVNIYGQQQGTAQSQGQRAFDITNLAQQLSAQQGNNGGNVDYGNNVNTLKLSALSTINSRVQLDSGKSRKHNDERGRNAHAEDFSRTSSVPPPQRINYYESIHHPTKELSKMASLNSATKNLTLDDTSLMTPLKSPQSPSGQPKSPAINPKQITNQKLLQDIPSWLKTLRLHKYTPCLQDTPWKELIYFDEDKLMDKGVTAMGARGKLLKAFEVVRQYYEDGLIE